MINELLNQELIEELFIKSDTLKEVPKTTLPTKKDLSEVPLNQELIMELFGKALIEEKNENKEEKIEKSPSHFLLIGTTPYRQEKKSECTFNQFVMIVTRFPTGKELVVKNGELVPETRIWFTLEEAVKRVRESGYGYHVTAEQAKKYLDSLVSQGFFEEKDGKYHKLMFCYHLSTGTCFFHQGEKDSSMLAIYEE